MDILEKSKLMFEKRNKFLIEQLNPHEKEMREFIKEVINKYNIKRYEEWCKYRELIPDCGSKTGIEFEFQGYNPKM